MRKSLRTATVPSRKAETVAGWEDSIHRALISMLTSEDPVRRAIAARLFLGDTYPSRRDGRLH